MKQLFLSYLLLFAISYAFVNNGFERVDTNEFERKKLLYKKDTLIKKCDFEVKTTIKTEKGRKVHIELKVKADNCEDAKKVLKKILVSTFKEKSR